MGAARDPSQRGMTGAQAPEMSRAEKEHLHMVVRSDDSGTTFLVRDGLSRAEAERAARTLEGRGHKQDYAVLAYAPGGRGALVARHGIQE